MSKDIRSFFNVLSTKGKPTKTQPVQKEESPSAKKRKIRKRAVILSDSEEDDEPKVKTPKRANSKSNGNGSLEVEKKKEESTSKYFSMSKDKMSSIFGTSPVKQVAPKSISTRKNTKSAELPPEIQKELVGLENLDDWGDDDFTEVNSSQLSSTSSKKPVDSDIGDEQKTPCRTARTISPAKRKAESPVSQSISPKKVAHSPPTRKEGPKATAKKEIPSLAKPSPEGKKLIVTVNSPKETSSSASTQSNSSQQSQTSSGDLWVDRYRPKNIKQIIGQQGENSNVQKLLKWLRAWHKNHCGEKKDPRPAPWAKDNTGAYFKAALLSGPPGIGKTTTAHLVCQELGLDVVEFNASDTRSKKLLSQEISELVSCQSLSNFAHSHSSSNLTAKNRVLVMDEVDGMAGNEDRGGIQELISIIKHSKVPVICMANDRNHPKIRSLVNYCFDLRFSRPRAEQIKGAMRSVCFKEGIKVEPSVLDGIIANANQDVRLVLNYLAMLASKVDDSMVVSTKDIKMGPWDVLRKVFSESDHKQMSIHDKCDLFFHDYSIAPLFVQENYLSVQPHSAEAKTKAGKMKLFAEAATSLSQGNLVETAIRTHNAWSLLPVQAVFSSLIPGDVLAGHMGGMINFPAWFGKNSKTNKIDRLTQEIQSHSRLRISGSKEAICLDYARQLRDLIVSPLVKHGSEGVQSALEAMRHYCLLREDIESLSEITSWPGMKDSFTGLDPKVKAAFTRAYNKNPVVTPFSTSSAVKGSRGRGGGDQESEDLVYGSEDPVEEVDDEGEDDDPDKDGMILKKKPESKKKNPETPKASKDKRKKDTGGTSKGKRNKK